MPLLHAWRARARAVPLALAVAGALVAPHPAAAQRAAPFTLAQLSGAPFPTELTAAATGTRVAWAFDEAGRRNVFVAEGPTFAARQLTAYTADDGQELTSVRLSRDGERVVYVRGGEHGASWDDALPVNPGGSPVPQKVGLWSVPFAGGTPTLLADGGDEPALSPRGDVVAFVKERGIWTVPLDGAQPARRLVAVRGDLSEPTWSPDGSRLAFVSGRGDHAFIGVWSGDSAAVTWIAPSTSRDRSPRWSPDGTRLAFVRTPGGGGAPDSILAPRPVRWAVWTADARTGAGRAVWTAPTTLRGSLPTTHGGPNLHWLRGRAGGRIAFVSYHDGWPHLYAIGEGGGEPLLLTPGRYMVEHVSATPDGRALLAAANAGPDALDIDRRHLLRVDVDRADARVLTPGAGLEWYPVMTGDGRHVLHVSATAQRHPLPAVLPVTGDGAAAGAARRLAGERIAASWPEARLVVPRQVVYRAPDGVAVHAQLFTPTGPPDGKRPAVIFVHGGPPRQMLLGWHYSDYYARAYALNQYLAARGFVVLSVNYRLGIGYGYEFHRPAGAGAQGAVEYQDVKAAGEWLAARPDVDASRIGLWGGSYGGFLVAMALAKDSRLFAAGVDLHGVHDWTTERARGIMDRTRFEQAPDLARALEVAWRSSPLSSLDGWRSPVLLVHGDDDRNVRFSQTVDLARRLEARNVPFEELIIPDDTHHWMRFANWVTVGEATAAFLDRTLGAARPADRVSATGR